MAFLPTPVSKLSPDSPDPMAALATLLGVAPDDLAASHMGPSAGAVSYSPNVEDATRLADSRETQLDAMKKSLETRAQFPIHVDPKTGRPVSTFVTGASPSDVSRLESDIHDSPTTGDAAQARTAKMQQLSDFFLPGAEQQRKEVTDTALAPERLKIQGAMDLEREKGVNARALQHGQFEENARTLNRLTGGGADGTSAGPDFKVAVNAKGGVSGSQVMPTAQVQNRIDMARSGLSEIPAARQMVDTLDGMGALGPMQGRLNSAATATGLSGLTEMFGITPKGSQRAFDDFSGQLKLIKTNLAAAHLGARGAASPQLQSRFDTLLNPNQTPDAIRGGLDVAERWLTHYAAAKNSAELDAADAELGITGGAYQRPQAGATSDDLGADFHTR